jgi:hypothetical protein
VSTPLRAASETPCTCSRTALLTELICWRVTPVSVLPRRLLESLLQATAVM